MKSQVEKWLKMAQADLGFAKCGLEDGYYSHVCFLSQQCAEKCLKALILHQGSMYPRSHKLVDLFTKLKEIGISKELEPFSQELKILDEYYIPTRYPDAIPGDLAEGLPSQQSAKEAFRIATKIYHLIKEKLEEEQNR